VGSVNCGVGAEISRSEAAIRAPQAATPTSPWFAAALKHNVDPLELYAIALQESRRSRPDGQLRPWPWTLHTGNEGTMYFNTYEAGLAKLKDLLKRGETNIDIGLMQINWAWNGHRLPDPAKLLLPQYNIDVAAKILREHLNAYGGDRRLAIALYHSSRPDLGMPYAAAVLEILKYLHTTEELKLTLAER
jgi:soluble lytic murein transglycosylase-like protein